MEKLLNLLKKKKKMDFSSQNSELIIFDTRFIFNFRIDFSLVFDHCYPEYDEGKALEMQLNKLNARYIYIYTQLR